MSEIDYKKLIVEAEKNQDFMLRLAVLQAEQKTTFYKACLNNGFSETQALELTKAYPL